MLDLHNFSFIGSERQMENVVKQFGMVEHVSGSVVLLRVGIGAHERMGPVEPFSVADEAPDVAQIGLIRVVAPSRFVIDVGREQFGADAFRR